MIGVARGLKAQMDNSKPSDSKQSSVLLYTLQDYSKSILPQNHRIQVCQHVPSYWSQLNGSHGGVSRRETGSHHLHGFGSCGDVRACPLCANKVGLQRAEEVKSVLKWHREQNNGIAFLVTYTCRHKSDSDLKFIAQRLAKSKRDFSSYTAVKNVKLLLGYTNMISARDMTHSFNNGFHPHYHDIWLTSSACYQPDYILTLSPKLASFALRNGLVKTDNSLHIASVKKYLAQQWITACSKNELLLPNEQRGFDIQHRKKDGSDAVGSYIVKWAYELTTPNRKVGRGESMTPMQILASVYDSEGRFHYKFAKLWREYIEAFAGMASLYFGKGLKKAAGITEESDEEIAEKPLPVPVREFTHQERLAVVYYKAQRKVIFYYDNYSHDVADAYLSELLRNYIEQKNSELKMRWHLKKKIAESSAKIIADLYIQQIEDDISRVA